MKSDKIVTGLYTRMIANHCKQRLITLITLITFITLITLITLIKIHLVYADEAKVEEMPAYLGVQHWPLPHKFPP